MSFNLSFYLEIQAVILSVAIDQIADYIFDMCHHSPVSVTLGFTA